jgi:hypothetical protein
MKSGMNIVGEVLADAVLAGAMLMLANHVYLSAGKGDWMFWTPYPAFAALVAAVFVVYHLLSRREDDRPAS